MPAPTFALGDSAAGYAALSLMEPGAEVLTVEMKVNLIAPAAGTRLIAEGEVVKPGRRLFVVRATVRSEAADGTLRDVALLQGTMIPGLTLRPSAPAAPADHARGSRRLPCWPEGRRSSWDPRRPGPA